MKKTKLLSLLLAAVLALSCVAAVSCSPSGTVMRYKNRVVTESDYAYVMAFIKGYYEYYYQQMAAYYGSTGLSLEDMYDNVSGEDGKTFADQLTDAVNQSSMMMLIVETLCDEAGLKVQDEETLAQIESAINDLRDDLGGGDALEIELAKKGFSLSSLERYEKYNVLVSLLRDYRYGEQGIAKIPDEDIAENFRKNYVKAEGYVFSFTEQDESGSTVQRVVDLTADASEQELEEAFLRLFLKAEYYSFDSEEELQEAIDGATGEITGGQHFGPVFLTREDAENGIYAKVEETGVWTTVAEEDGVYYVRLSEPAAGELTGNEEAARDALASERAHEYFTQNYVTVRHILYDKADEETAKSVCDGIKAGTTTFEEHESETKDSGVQYTFTKGIMVEPFETASYALAVGEVTVAETEDGFHVILRMELDETKYSEDDVKAAMSKEILRAAAEEEKQAIEAAGSGYVFREPEEGDLFAYSDASVLQLSNLNAQLSEALNNAAEGETVTIELAGTGVFLLRKLKAEQADIDTVASEISEGLVSDAYFEYLKSFFDQVETDSERMAKFNIRTAETFYF